MNKEEVINKINEMTVETFFSKTLFVQQKKVIELIEQLDEPEAGHADEAPRYVKNILARLRELPLHDREVWLKAIMGEFEQDFSHAKWREGYEQGKLEGMVEREKVIVPQFVADWYEENKDNFDYKVWECVFHDGKGEKTEMSEWINRTENAFITLVNMHQFGFEVEKEKRYLVKLKNNSEYVDYLVDTKENGFRFYSNIYTKRREHTRKELEDTGFGWVFNCPGIEIEEVEE
jgi:hypothetical protein